MKSTNKILAGIVTGAAVGAILGLLFAPDKGSETRKKIKEEKNKLADELKEKLRKGKEKLNDLKENFTYSAKQKKEELS